MACKRRGLGEVNTELVSPINTTVMSLVSRQSIGLEK